MLAPNIYYCWECLLPSCGTECVWCQKEEEAK